MIPLSREMAAEFFRTDHLTIKHTTLFVLCVSTCLFIIWWHLCELLWYKSTYRFSAPPTPHWFQYYIECSRSPTGFPSFTARWCMRLANSTSISLSLWLVFWESLNQLSPAAGWSDSSFSLWRNTFGIPSQQQTIRQLLYELPLCALITYREYI
jgi:MFS superfamily sulfate permease-like transporter